MISQPVRDGERAEARAAAQEQPPRRIGQELRRVLDQEPGRRREWIFANETWCLSLPAADHGAQALRHDEGEHHVHDQEPTIAAMAKKCT